MFFFCKQKTSYEMRISDWSSDVCSSDLSPRLYRVLAPDSEPTPFPVFAHYSHRCFDVSSKPLVEPPITSRPLWHLPGRKDRVRHQNPLGPGPRGVHHRAGVGLVRDPMDSGGARPPTPAWLALV